MKIMVQKRAHAPPFFDDFISEKIVKSLIDPLKGAALLNGVIMFMIKVVAYNSHFCSLAILARFRMQG